MNTYDIVQKLWSLCNVLRDDGITYHEYVTELTYLLFLKMTQETGTEVSLDHGTKKELVHIPEGLRWADLAARRDNEQLQFYRRQLVELGNEGSELVQQIFLNANTSLRQPRNLNKLVTSIDELDWFSARREGLGDLYEGLLEKAGTLVPGRSLEHTAGRRWFFVSRELGRINGRGEPGDTLAPWRRSRVRNYLGEG